MPGDLAYGRRVLRAVLASSGPGAAQRPAAFVDGINTAVTINAVIVVAAAIVAALTLRGHQGRERPFPESPATRQRPAAASAR